MYFGEVYQPHRGVFPWTHPLQCCLLSCFYLLLTASVLQAADLQDAVQSVARDIWAEEPRSDGFDGCVAVALPRSDRPEEARICGGLLVSALQRLSPEVVFRLDDSDLLFTTARPSSLDAAALRRLGQRFECGLLIACELLIQDALGALHLTLWDLEAGHALGLAEAVFDVPMGWAKLDDLPELRYALRWRSRVFVRERFLAVAVGDFSGNALNEVALATDSHLFFQSWTGRELRASETPIKVYWEDTHQQHRAVRDRRSLHVLHSRVNDQLLVSVPTNWNATVDSLQFEQTGMVVAVAGDQIWRTHFMVDPLRFSGEKTSQILRDETNRQSMPQDYHALWIANVDDTPEQEYLLINLHGSLCVYHHTDDFELWWQSPPYFGTALAVGDLDGNQYPEIVCTSKASDQTDQISILEWDGQFYTQRAQWDMPGPVQAMTIGDVNNDDIEELLVVVDHPLGSMLYLYHTRLSNFGQTSEK